MSRQRIAIALVGCALAAGAQRAHANEAGPSPADRAAAQVLFDEGKKLESKNEWKAACAKFKESQRLEPAFGTQLNLARCFTKIGRTASAWITFLEAAATAKKQQREKRIAVAKGFAKKLETKLVRLRIVVESPAAGITLKRGSTALRQAQWGIAVPVDPAQYTIQASAPGKKTWTKKLEAKEAGKTFVVRVPKLLDAPKESTAAAKKPAAGSKLFLGLGIGSGALALGGAILGSVMSAGAVSKRDESLQYCLQEDANLCLPEGVALRQDALSSATVATAGFVSAGVLAAASATFFVLHFRQGAPEKKPDANALNAVLLPVLNPQTVGFELKGAF